MVSAQRLVLVRAPHANLLSLLGHPRFPTRINRLRAVPTLGAERTELVDDITVRHELQELAEGLGHGIAVQTHTNHVLLFDIGRAQSESLQILKELGLFNDDVGRCGKLGRLQKRHEVAHGRCGVALAGVSHDGVVRITSIKTACNTESLDTDEFMAAKNAQDGRGLSSEHGTGVDIQRHCLMCL